MDNKSDIKKLKREMLRLYAGAGAHTVLGGGIVWALINQLNQEEHLSSAMLVMAAVYFADQVGEKIEWVRNIRMRILLEQEKEKQRQG